MALEFTYKRDKAKNKLHVMYEGKEGFYAGRKWVGGGLAGTVVIVPGGIVVLGIDNQILHVFPKNWEGLKSAVTWIKDRIKQESFTD